MEGRIRRNGPHEELARLLQETQATETHQRARPPSHHRSAPGQHVLPQRQEDLLGPQEGRIGGAKELKTISNPQRKQRRELILACAAGSRGYSCVLACWSQFSF